MDGVSTTDRLILLLFTGNSLIFAHRIVAQAAGKLFNDRLITRVSFSMANEV